MNPNNIRIFISQRILTRYREEAFFELARDERFRIFVAFGDRKGKKYHKYASIKSIPRFPHARLGTLSLIFGLFNHVNQLFFSPGVLRELMKFKPHVVLTEGTSNILNNVLICTYCLVTRKPYIWWDLGRIRGQDKENKFRRILYPLISFYFRRAAIILGYSSFAREYFLSIGIPADRIIVAGNTLGLDRHLQFQNTKKKNAEKLKMELKLANHFVFLTVGALEKPKRFELLVDSFRKLSQKDKDMKETKDKIAEFDYYILFIWGDVEPSIYGPYNTEEERDNDAIRIRKEEGDENGIYKLYVEKGSKVEVYPYSGSFFEEEVK